MTGQPSSAPEAEIQIPADIQRILSDPTLSPGWVNWFLPDITVSAVPKPGWPSTTCNRVTFTVTLRPGLRPIGFPQPTGNRSVKVRVIDKISGVPTTVAEALLLVPAAGGSTTACLEWPMPEDAAFHPDFTNEITIIADPDRAIAERNEANNKVTIEGTCRG